MNNPVFSSSFSKLNGDLMNKINALVSNPNINILSTDQLLQNVESIKLFNKFNEDAAKLLALDLLKNGLIDPKQMIENIVKSLSDAVSKSLTQDDKLNKLLDY